MSRYKYTPFKKDLKKHSFSLKEWFRVMWGVGYIQFFICMSYVEYFMLSHVNEIITPMDKANLSGVIFILSGYIIIPLTLTLIAYKMGNYWREYKNNAN